MKSHESWICQVLEFHVPHGRCWKVPCLDKLGSGSWFQTCFIFTLLGEMIQFDEHIFQMGWFNHQLGMFRSTHRFFEALEPAKLPEFSKRWNHLETWGKWSNVRHIKRGGKENGQLLDTVFRLIEYLLVRLFVEEFQSTRRVCVGLLFCKLAQIIYDHGILTVEQLRFLKIKPIGSMGLVY